MIPIRLVAGPSDGQLLAISEPLVSIAVFVEEKPVLMHRVPRPRSIVRYLDSGGYDERGRRLYYSEDHRRSLIGRRELAAAALWLSDLQADDGRLPSSATLRDRRRRSLAASILAALKRMVDEDPCDPTATLSHYVATRWYRARVLVSPGRAIGVLEGTCQIASVLIYSSRPEDVLADRARMATSPRLP